MTNYGSPTGDRMLGLLGLFYLVFFRTETRSQLLGCDHVCAEECLHTNTHTLKNTHKLSEVI